MPSLTGPDYIDANTATHRLKQTRKTDLSNCAAAWMPHWARPAPSATPT